MHPPRALAQILACILLLVTGCSGQPRPAPTPTAQLAAPTPEAIATPTEEPPTPAARPVQGAAFEEGPCSFDVPAGVQANCGYVVVPEDHGQPTGPTIRLAVAVFKSESSAPRPDPVIVLAGGPGEKALEYAPSILQEWQPMVGDRDLVIFDQRGAGQSEPALECPELEQALYDLLDEPDPDVSEQISYEAMMACRERLEQEGRNLSAYNSSQNAADVELLRVALGYEQVNLVGGSYGSFLAQAVMRDHPAGIRCVVVSSVLPLEKSFFIDSIPAAPGAITHLLDACAADPDCDAAYPKLTDLLYETIDRLNREPVPVTLTHPVTGEGYDAVMTGDDVVGNLVMLLYWTEFIPTLPRAIYDVSQGDYKLMTDLFSLNLISFDAVSRGMEYSVLCSEDLIGRTAQEYLDNIEALPEPLQGQASPETAARYNPCAVCQDWKVEQADASAKQPLTSEIPTLILEGEFDPVTPPEYGQELAGHLPNSYYFTLPGAGHNVLSASGCAQDVVRAFLDDPAHKPAASCVAKMAGVAFVVPAGAQVTLQPYTNEESGFKGVVPEGWNEISPGSFMRGQSMDDATVLAQQAGEGSASLFLAVLAARLKLDPEVKPVRRAKLGVLTWNLYELEIQGFPLDLALAEQDGIAYMVMMTSARDERDALYEQVFLPAVKAMAPLGE